MPNYVLQKLKQYQHPHPKKPQHSPYPATPIKYGKHAQKTTPPDTSPSLSAADKKRLEQIIGSFLYYARALDLTMLKALNSLASKQSKPTENTKKHSPTSLIIALPTLKPKYNTIPPTWSYKYTPMCLT